MFYNLCLLLPRQTLYKGMDLVEYVGLPIDQFCEYLEEDLGKDGAFANADRYRLWLTI